MKLEITFGFSGKTWKCVGPHFGQNFDQRRPSFEGPSELTCNDLRYKPPSGIGCSGRFLDKLWPKCGHMDFSFFPYRNLIMLKCGHHFVTISGHNFVIREAKVGAQIRPCLEHESRLLSELKNCLFFEWRRAHMQDTKMWWFLKQISACFQLLIVSGQTKMFLKLI